MSGSKKLSGFAHPTYSSAARASLVDEEKRKEKAKENKTDKIQMGYAVAAYSPSIASRAHERVSVTTPANDRVVSKPPKSTSVKSVPLMTKPAVNHSSGALEKSCAKSLSIDNRKSSSKQYAGTTASTDEKPSHSNGKPTKLTRSLSNDESSTLQKTSDRSDSVHMTSHLDTLQARYDTPSLSYAKTFSAQTTSAARNPELRDNLDFYLGRIKSKPEFTGQHIEEMLKWKGDYEILERNHGYIQWLFPIPEGSGVNIYAQPLTEYEAEEIRHNDKASNRVLRAYKMMLDFYGMKLADDNVGTVERALRNYKERYEHLNRSRHNLLRITRIIKSLGELGFERFQARWLNFLFKESVVNKVLNFSQGCFNHWINAIKDDSEREVMYRKIHGLTLNVDEPYNANSESEGDEDIGSLHASDTRDTPQEGATAGMISTTKEVPSKREEKNVSPDTVYDPLNETDRKVATDGMSYTAKEIPSKDGKKNFFSCDTAYDPLSENDQKISGVHEEFSERDVRKEGEDIDELHNDNGYEDDAEDDRNHKTLHRFEGNPMDESLPCDNWRFYTNQIHSRPSPGFTIETILGHTEDYSFLAEYPYFIQWLFPTPTPSRVNEKAQPLYKHEAEAIVNDEEAFKRVSRAYILILDYYGMKLDNVASGKLKKSNNWKSRWKELNASENHEFMRVTRILKSLGEFGYERYQVPLIQMFIINGLQTDKYIKGLTWEHALHWINCINDEGERQALFEQYKHIMFRDSRSDRQVRRNDHSQHGYQHTDTYPSLWSDTFQYMHL